MWFIFSHSTTFNMVCLGNISTCTCVTLYFTSSKLNACLCGRITAHIHNPFGSASRIALITSSCIPARWVCNNNVRLSIKLYEVFIKYIFHIPRKKRVLLIPFNSELTFASSIASSTYSIPTLLALRAIKFAIGILDKDHKQPGTTSLSKFSSNFI